MSHIEIPIWNKCNNNCVMCTNTIEMRRDTSFNYDSVITFLEKEIKKNNSLVPESIGLTGGETTICPDFFRIINYIRNKFPETTIRLLTNGRMFAYSSFRKKCLAFKKIDFIIPLHGYDAKSHDQITQSPGSFNQTSEGLKKLLAEKRTDQKIEIRIIATRLNLKIIPKILELIEKRFFGVDRVVLIFLEFEGKAEVNKNRVGITYQQIQLILEQIKKYPRIFKDFRLYHFPLCVLEPDLWPNVWRTLPKEEITFLPECQRCLLKKYCLGLHKSYLGYVKKPEIQPWLSLKGTKIKETGNFYNPINSIKIDKVLYDLKALTRLTDFLMNRKTESTKYFFSSLFFRLKKSLNQYNAKDIKKWWLRAVRNNRKNNKPSVFNLYLHIPFCKSRCSYCMYPSIASWDKKLMEHYLKKVSNEISFYRNIFSKIKFQNIYIGGGCPNILSEKQIVKLLTNLSSNFKFSKFGEKNFECNPQYITLKKLEVLKKFGFNRVSFGVQSLNPKVLKYANRDYQTYKTVKKAILTFLSSGFKVNVDLMIGLQGDSPQSVKESFQKIIELKPTEISLYPLKPSGSYLKKYFGNNEKIFYSQLKKKIDQTLKLLKEIAIRFNYTYPETVCLGEGYCVNFSQKERKEKIKDRYYNIHLPHSTLGIGSFSVSRIIGLGRYHNNSSIGSAFDPLSYCYRGAACQLRDDMRDYILDHFAKGRPVSQKEFKIIFNQNLIKSFQYPFSALKKLKKIKIDKDKIYFLPKDLKEMFIYGLFFWDKNEVIQGLMLNKLSKED